MLGILHGVALVEFVAAGSRAKNSNSARHFEDVAWWPFVFANEMLHRFVWLLQHHCKALMSHSYLYLPIILCDFNERGRISGLHWLPARVLSKLLGRKTI